MKTRVILTFVLALFSASAFSAEIRSISAPSESTFRGTQYRAREVVEQLGRSAWFESWMSESKAFKVAKSREESWKDVALDVVRNVAGEDAGSVSLYQVGRQNFRRQGRKAAHHLFQAIRDRANAMGYTSPEFIAHRDSLTSSEPALATIIAAAFRIEGALLYLGEIHTRSGDSRFATIIDVDNDQILFVSLGVETN